ncbi:MAG: fumarylacetoacetate hydrolase family protein [Acidothermus cellulolyticus]|nr:fumarylacetoacetate hydrolase family protein [Acidothermus cellulolyticus]MCL6550638.1 fumarylacetoacetate hydrolase family protein [Acidothermus cellulolyticus]
MRIARFAPGPDGGGFAFGVVEGEQDSAQVRLIDGHPFGELRLTDIRRPLADLRLVAPVLPSKVIAVGKNYADHAREMGGEPPDQPVIFLKPSTAVIGPGSPIVYPSQLSARVDYEGELAVVIGRLCRSVPVSRAHEVILGYTCGNDVTARDLQQRDGQWTRAKGFDTFCPLGPWIETEVDPSDLEVMTTVNGEVRQRARTSSLVHGVAELVAFISAVMTLLPGDVILTGTPAGVGPVQPGDDVTVTIERIGSLTNPVVASKLEEVPA